MSNLHADHYFHIGHSHFVGGKPCQDYAISGTYENIAFAVVSDGCSTGGQTDVGARVLALSTASAIQKCWIADHDVFGDSVIKEVGLWQKIVSAHTRQTLNLKHEDMLATCLYSFLTPLGGYIHVLGDGVVVFKDLNGKIIMHRFEWKGNMPFYSAYTENGLDLFIKAHGGELKTPRLIQETCIYENKDTKIERDSKHLTLQDGIRGVTLFVPSRELTELSFIGIFSDGVTQIDGVLWEDAVVDLMAFKNVNGEFVKRRMIRGIKDTKKKGSGPVDDIACAVTFIDRDVSEDNEVYDDGVEG